MIKNEYRVIGVMSGTSLDGIDLALVTFYYNKHWTFSIEVSETVSYSNMWLLKLKRLINYSIEELQEIDDDYTLYLATIIKDFIKKNDIDGVDAICSHGHTALHQPENKLTYQIGNLPSLALALEETIVCDFRLQDVKMGGQGAPLVPIGDALLFKSYEYCVNLGGFANVSTVINGNRIAFDICPVNIILNHYVSKLGLNYDNKGALASKGQINEALLNDLNVLPFYKLTYPKSLGLEWVNNIIFPLINEYKLPINTILRTVVEHIAIQISLIINVKQKSSVFVTGGGVFNTFLMSRIEALSGNPILIPSKEIVEFKEALIFGFLGVLKLRNETNCLASVTGARKDHSSGKVYVV